MREKEFSDQDVLSAGVCAKIFQTFVPFRDGLQPANKQELSLLRIGVNTTIFTLSIGIGLQAALGQVIMDRAPDVSDVWPLNC